MADLATHLPGGWAMPFAATDFEVGHWDHRRFRNRDGVDASAASPAGSVA